MQKRNQGNRQRGKRYEKKQGTQNTSAAAPPPLPPFPEEKTKVEIDPSTRVAIVTGKTQEDVPRRIIIAPSGAGKTTLAQKYPDRWVDADTISKYPPFDKADPWWNHPEKVEEVEKANSLLWQKWRDSANDGLALLAPTSKWLDRVDGFWKLGSKTLEANLAQRETQKMRDQGYNDQPGPSKFAEIWKGFLEEIAAHPEVPAVGLARLALGPNPMCVDCEKRSAVGWDGQRNKRCQPCYETNKAKKKQGGDKDATSVESKA